MMVKRYDVNDTYPHVVTFGLGDKPAKPFCNDRGNRVTLGENYDNLVGYMHRVAALILGLRRIGVSMYKLPSIDCLIPGGK